MSKDTTEELDKWETYYASCTTDELLREGGEVYSEIAEVMAALLPVGGAVLEAACGSGRHSMELAKLGDYNLTMLDFSPNAIGCARRLGEKMGVAARFMVGDVFSDVCPEQFDLVFNAGVLEHYSYQRQVDFLTAMRLRSRRYVLVLVPNRECHWYWIYRMQRMHNGQWPFGYEKPASSYRKAMTDAGLHYLGRAYLGAAATTWFMEHIDGLSPELRDLVATMHRQEIFSPGQRSYLVAFLASVTSGGPHPLPAPFMADVSHEEDIWMNDWTDRCVTLAADALASQISLRMDIERLRKERDDLVRKMQGQ